MYTKYFLSSAEEYTQGNIRSMKELRLVHVFRKGRCVQEVSKMQKLYTYVFGFKSGAHGLRSLVDTEGGMVRHSCVQGRCVQEASKMQELCLGSSQEHMFE